MRTNRESAVAITLKAKSEKPGREKQCAKTFLEFFAGIGLIREGLSDSGWNCVYANDIDPKKEEQYVARFGGEHFHREDVKKTQAILDVISENPVLATASFPCIDLSLAGHWRGFEGEHSSTFFAFADVLAAMKGRLPKLVMLENVAGLLSSHNGKDFSSVATSLANLGYFLDSFVIDAKYFVPQSRVRVFVIGIHESVIGKCESVRSNEGALPLWNGSCRRIGNLWPARLAQLMETIELPTGWIVTPIEQPPTVRQHLREFIDLDECQEWWDSAQVAKHFDMMSDLHKSQVNLLMQDKHSIHVGTIYRRKRYGKTRAEIRFDGMAGCLRVPRGGSARQIVLVIDNGKLRIRWMSPREYARLQGTPNFPLVGRPGQQMAGFGDAVCVPVIRWIDQQVLTPLYEAIAK